MKERSVKSNPLCSARQLITVQFKPVTQTEFTIFIGIHTCERNDTVNHYLNGFYGTLKMLCGATKNRKII